MIKQFFAFLLLLASIVAQAPTIEELDSLRVTHRVFLDALAQVESNGKDDAVGDNGKALGRYQVWETYWTDALGKCPDIGGKYKDVVDRDYAERVVMAYFLRYGKKALARSDYEMLSRIHNGGPKGYRVKATLPYWKKVENAMAKIKAKR